MLWLVAVQMIVTYLNSHSYSEDQNGSLSSCPSFQEMPLSFYKVPLCDWYCRIFRCLIRLLEIKHLPPIHRIAEKVIDNLMSGWGIKLTWKSYTIVSFQFFREGEKIYFAPEKYFIWHQCPSLASPNIFIECKCLIVL